MTTAAVPVPGYFSDVFGMGAAREFFPVRKMSKWGSVISALIFLGGAAIAFLGGLWYTYDMWQRHGPAVILRSLALPLIGSIVLLLIGLLSLWSVYTNWRKSAVVYTNGFAYSDRKGVKAWRWEEVETIRAAVTRHYTNGVYTGTTHVYTVEKRDGERLALNDSLQQVEKLASMIREQTFPQMYQRYSASYNSGQPVIFGPVVLSRTDGIQMGKKSYPWDQVAAVSIDKGTIQVAKKGGGWFSGASVPAASVPNVEILLSIVDQVVGLKTGK